MSHVLLRPVIAVSMLTALTGCWFSERVEEFSGPTMGSTYTIKYVRGQSSPGIDLLKRETESILAEVDLQLSTYRADSVIEKFNQAPAGTVRLCRQGCWNWWMRVTHCTRKVMGFWI
jgi:thiamine biosynthesis lipoprotein